MFSDGVLAIVITLLVIEVRPPEHDDGELFTELVHQWPAYLGFLTSFIYVGVIWLNHHAAFRRIRHLDRGLNFANLGVLATTAFLPFPTAVLAEAMADATTEDQRIAVALYGAVASLMCASWLGLYHYLARSPRLHVDDGDRRFFHGERVRAVAGIAAYGLAVGLAWMPDPTVSLLVLFAIPIFYAVTSEGWGEPIRRRRAVDADVPS